MLNSRRYSRAVVTKVPLSNSKRNDRMHATKGRLPAKREEEEERERVRNIHIRKREKQRDRGIKGEVPRIDRRYL